MDEIVYLSLASLVASPLQEKIYGIEPVDAELTASIAERGVLQPLIVADNVLVDGDAMYINPNAGAYMIVSGFRRSRSSAAAGLEVVPCVRKTYANLNEVEVDFLVSNISRNKTEAQKNAEFNRWYERAVKYAKYKQSLGLKQGDVAATENLRDGESDEFVEIVEILKSRGFDLSDSFKAAEFVGSLTGLSEHEIKQRNFVLSLEFRDKKISDLQKAGLGKKAVSGLLSAWQAIELRYKNGLVELPAAVKEVKALLADFGKSVSKAAPSEPRAKKSKTTPKKKIYIAGPITGVPGYRDRFAAAAAELGDKWDVVSPPEVTKLDPNSEWIELMEELLPILATCDAVVLLDGFENSNGSRIERVVAKILNKELFSQSDLIG